MFMLLGVDIGGTKCALCVGGADGKTETKVRFETTDCETTVQTILAHARALAEAYPLTACGVSCGGPLDEEAGVILSPPNLPGWDHVEIRRLLEEATGLPVRVRNDANAGALAEWRYGAGKGTRHMVFMTFGTGLGAGLILNGQLYAGACGLGGELGHIRLAETGPAGYGKCGSFEGFCSGSGLYELGRALGREARQRGEAVPWMTDDFTVRDMAEAARAGDQTAKAAFDLCGKKLGQGLAIVADLLNPEVAVIGSVFARCEDLLRKPMEEELKKEALPGATKAMRVVPASLGESIGDMAALAVAGEAEA